MVSKPNTRKNAKSNSFTYFAKFVKFFFILFMIITMAGSLYVAKIVLDIAEEAPEVSINRFLSLNEPSIVLDDEGNQMDLIHTDEVRFPIALEDMGQNIIDAFISIEDERFEKHKGVDYRRTIGVTLRDIVGQVTGNRDMQGGSTLTQQIIKNTFLTREQKYERKIKEIFMALRAEKMLTKDQILETYLNSIFLGGRANGVEAAARQYFNKSAKDLTVIEAAYIAGTTQSPTNFYAFSQSSTANPQKYINRTQLVLNAMRDNKKISEEEYAQYTDQLNSALIDPDEKIAKGEELRLKFESGEITEEEYNYQTDVLETGIVFNQTSIVSDKYNYEYFTRPVLDQVKADLKEVKGYTDEEIEQMIAYGGLVIHSTMDRDAQDYAQSVLSDFENVKAEYVLVLEEEDKATGTIVEKEDRREAEAAFSAVDYKSGQVKVLVGGRDASTPGTKNRSYYSDTFGVLGVLRGLGSATKPLTVYGPALESGTINLGYAALDEQFKRPQDNAILNSINVAGNRTSYPNNVTFRYTGPTTIRKSLVNSYNTVAMRTLIGLGDFQSVAMSYGEKFGLVFPKNEDGSYNRAPVQAAYLSLGRNQQMDKDGANPLIVSGAYGAFGNNGVVTENILYTKVTDADGRIILEKIPESTQVLSAQNAYLLYDVMKDVVKNNVPGTRLTSMPLAGKTGTNTKGDQSDQIDLWFAGVSPYYSATIWFGNDYNSRLLIPGTDRGISSYSTQYAYGKIMAYLHEGLEVKDIARPSGLTSASFCFVSGGIPNEQCYIENTVASDLFVSGTQPKQVCTVHTYEPPVIDPIPEEPETPAQTPGNPGNGNGNGN